MTSGSIMNLTLKKVVTQKTMKLVFELLNI